MTKNIAEQAYNYALAGKAGELKELDNSDYLTQFHHEFHAYFNAPAKLAFEGHHAAAELFLNCETGDVDHLIHGYSEAGNVERVQYWLDRGGDYALAVRGLAFAGANEAVEAIINESDDEDKTFILTINAIEGYARAGNHDKVNHYLENVFEEDTEELEDAIRAAINGYAKVPAYTDQANALIQTEEDQHAFYSEVPYHVFRETFENINPEFRYYAFLQAAKLGDDAFINTNLAQYHRAHIHSREASEKLLNDIYYNYLTHGHRNAAEQFTEQFKYGDNQPFPKSRDTEYLDMLLSQKQVGIAASHWLDHEELDPSVCASQYGQDKADDYMQLSTFGQLAARLSRDPKERTKQLLSMRDEAVSERLLWLQVYKMPYAETGPMPEWDVYKRIENRFHFTPLSYDAAWTFNSKDSFNNVFNLICVSIHESAGPLGTSNVMNLILAYVLGISEESADIIREDFTDKIIIARSSVKNKRQTSTSSRSSSPDLDLFEISPYCDRGLMMFSPAPSRSPSPERPRSPSPTLRRMG